MPRASVTQCNASNRDEVTCSSRTYELANKQIHTPLPLPLPGRLADGAVKGDSDPVTLLVLVALVPGP